jgi:hypothetical protein
MLSQISIISPMGYVILVIVGYLTLYFAMSLIKARFKNKLPGANIPAGKSAPERLIHILIGEFDRATGMYEGEGLHSPRIAKSACENRVIKFSKSSDGKDIISNFNELPKNVNGVRRGYLKTKNGTWVEKTFFPDDWSDADIVDAIVEASKVHKPSIIDEFEKNVSRNGKTLKISGTLVNNLIYTAYPVFES